MKKKFSAVAAPCALVLTLGACGGSGDDGKKPSSPTASAAASSSSASSGSSSDSSAPGDTAPTSASSGDASTSGAPAPSGSSSGSAEAASLPEGTQRITAPRSGISFAVPKGWQTIDPALIKQPQMRARVEAAAKRMHMTPEEFAQRFSQQAEILAVSTQPTAGFADNVSSAMAMAAHTLPTKEQLDPQITQAGAQTTKFEEVQTPLGKGVKDVYDITTSGVHAHGVLLVVPNSHGSLSMLTFSSSSTEKAQQYADDAVKTLQKS